MGKTPGEIEAEIERLRSESEEIVEELERRASVPNLLQGAATAVADTATTVVGTVTDTAGNVASEVVAEVPEIVRNNRQMVRGVALSAMLGLGVYAVSTSLLGHRNRAVERQIGDSARRPNPVQAIGEEVDEALSKAIHRAKADRVGLVIRKEEPGMLKRVLWVALASAMATFGSMMFKRLTATAWRSAMHEEPPR